MLLKLKDLGVNVYLYDSITSNRSFHMKSYLFLDNDNQTLIVGSSNLSITALRTGQELNLITTNYFLITVILMFGLTCMINL